MSKSSFSFVKSEASTLSGSLNPSCDYVDHDGDGLLVLDGDCDDYDDMAEGFGSVEDGAGDIALVMEPPGRRARSPVSIRRPGAFDSRRCDAIDAVPRRRWTASLGKRE